MGLDTLEIIMNCEDAFGITIRDEDAEKLRTAGDLHSLIMRLLGERQGAWVCPSSHVFYRLRTELMKLGMPRRRIHPNVRVSEIVANVGEARWPKVREALEIPRNIRLPGWVELLVLGAAISAGVGTKLMSSSIWVGIAAGTVAGYILYSATRPMRIELQLNESLRELSYELASRNRRKMKSIGKFSEAEAWEIIRGILAEQLGIPMEEIKRESRFIEDLGTG